MISNAVLLLPRAYVLEFLLQILTDIVVIPGYYGTATLRRVPHNMTSATTTAALRRNGVVK